MPKTKNAEAIPFSPSLWLCKHLARQTPKKMLLPSKKPTQYHVLLFTTQPQAHSSETLRHNILSANLKPSADTEKLPRHSFPHSLHQTTKIQAQPFPLPKTLLPHTYPKKEKSSPTFTAGAESVRRNKAEQSTRGESGGRFLSSTQAAPAGHNQS